MLRYFSSPARKFSPKSVIIASDALPYAPGSEHIGGEGHSERAKDLNLKKES